MINTEYILLIAAVFTLILSTPNQTFGKTSTNTTAQPVKSYAPYPEPDLGYVTDIAGQLTDEQERQIENWLTQTEQQTGVQIALVIINSIRDYTGSANSSIETFATGLFDAYGIGNMPKNDGVLLVIAIKDRKARIELGAYYGRTRDGDAQNIMDKTIIPQFKKNNYAAGITNGVKALMREFADNRGDFNWLPYASGIGIPLLILISVLIAYSIFNSGKRGWGWITIGLSIVSVIYLLRLIKSIGRSLGEIETSSWSRGGGFGGGGFVGGGFGGGFSGGGGATGGW